MLVFGTSVYLVVRYAQTNHRQLFEMLFIRLRINESFEQFAMQITEVSWDAETGLVFVVYYATENVGVWLQRQFCSGFDY